jgi:GT2 family glycosyltransferase
MARGADSLHRADVAIVVPSIRETVDRLLADLERQTLRARVLVVKDVRPNGKARNEGARRCLDAAILVFIDDDARLVDRDALERMLAPLDKDPDLAVSGAAKTLLPGASRFERRVAREVPRVVHEASEQDRESNPLVAGYGFSCVTTTCCAIRREWLERAGGFREDIERGVDTELFWRLRRAGARFVVAGGARVAHPAPRDLGALLARMSELGFAHAREAALNPERGIGPELSSRPRALAYLAARALYLPANVLVPWSRAHPRIEIDVKPLKALASFAAAVGYVRGSLA